MYHRQYGFVYAVFYEFKWGMTYECFDGLKSRLYDMQLVGFCEHQ